MQNTSPAAQSSPAVTSTITLAPVSPALAALLHQVQEQIIREAGEHAEPARNPLGPLWAPITRFDDGDDITWHADNGREQAVRRRFCPESWVGSNVPWHPSHWRGYSYRKGPDGRPWTPEYGSVIYVTDDFGTLVPVQQ